MSIYLPTLLFTLLAFLPFTPASAEGNEEPIKLEMRELGNFRSFGQYIEIRGFLYQDEAGDRILADQPNLRTCCVGSDAQKNSQIAIRGNLDTPESGFPVTLRGLLIRNKGKTPQYSLENAVTVEEADQQRAANQLLPVFLGSAGLLAALVLLSRLKLLK